MLTLCAWLTSAVATRVVCTWRCSIIQSSLAYVGLGCAHIGAAGQPRPPFRREAADPVPRAPGGACLNYKDIVRPSRDKYDAAPHYRA